MKKLAVYTFFVYAPAAWGIALPVLLFSSGDRMTRFWLTILTFVVTLTLILLWERASTARGDQPDDSVDIINAAYNIRVTYGQDAQKEFLQAIARSKNNSEYKFAPGQNRETMAAKAREISRKYHPISLIEKYKP